MGPRRVLVPLLVVGLVLFGVFSAVSSNMQRDAWLQGYLMGQLAAGGEGAKAPSVAPLLYGPYGGLGGPRFFNPFGFIFPLLFLGLVFFGLSRLFRFWAWRHWGGPGMGPWGRHGGPRHWRYGQPGLEGQEQPAPEGQPGAPGRGQPWGPWGWPGANPPGWGQAPAQPAPPEAGTGGDQPRNASYI